METFISSRETHGSGAGYHKELAKELADALQKLIMVLYTQFLLDSGVKIFARWVYVL